MRAEVSIERTGLEGQGVGYDANRNIYFVPGAVPGDRLLVEYQPDTKRYRDAVLVEVLSPSSLRVDPQCDYFRQCGGCDWLHWDYLAQLSAKEAMVRHVLDRAAVRPVEMLPMLASPEVFGYRNRIQVRRRGDELGFFRRKSHDIVNIERCAVAHPELNLELARVRREIPPADPTKIEMMVDEAGNVRRVYDEPHGALGFRQVNSGQNENLRRLVAEQLRSRGARRVLELFCGEGNLTFRFVAEVNETVGIDSSERAIETARGIAAEREIANVHFIASEVRASTPQKLPAEFRTHYDTLILDPPRQGVGISLEFFVHPLLNTVVYVSCSPTSFSQDARVLAKSGFTLVQVQPIDMFPHTRHIELLAVFVRSWS